MSICHIQLRILVFLQAVLEQHSTILPGGVMAFAAPHAELGEVVAVALTRTGNGNGWQSVREWMLGRLSARSVPQLFVHVPSLPCGSTGKLKRLGYAAWLGLDPLQGSEPITLIARFQDMPDETSGGNVSDAVSLELLVERGACIGSTPEGQSHGLYELVLT